MIVKLPAFCRVNYESPSGNIGGWRLPGGNHGKCWLMLDVFGGILTNHGLELYIHGIPRIHPLWARLAIDLWAFIQIWVEKTTKHHHPQRWHTTVAIYWLSKWWINHGLDLALRKRWFRKRSGSTLSAQSIG